MMKYFHFPRKVKFIIPVLLFPLLYTSVACQAQPPNNSSPPANTARQLMKNLSSTCDTGHLQPDAHLPDLELLDGQSLENALLHALNNGQTAQLLARYGCTSYPCANSQIGYSDLTQDDRPEIIFSGSLQSSTLYVFGCTRGTYQTLLREQASSALGAPYIVTVQDMNANGLPDLVTAQFTCHYCTGVHVYEWDGKHFSSLVRAPNLSSDGTQDFAEMMGYSTVSISDTDKNGTFEIIIQGGIPSWLAGISGGEGPYREKTAIYAWNGQHFILQSLQYAAPRFRFEAVQDADRAVENNDLDTALAYYQRVISDSSLVSWSHDAWFDFIRQQHTAEYPSDLSWMPYNPTEHAQLSAYSLYRIGLVYLKKGQEEQAARYFQELANQFPVDSPGYPYSELAAKVWEEWQVFHALSQACRPAIAYAQAHPEILIPLGDYENHGLFVRGYTPEMICPYP